MFDSPLVLIPFMLDVPRLNDKLKHIGHSLSRFCAAELLRTSRQTEVYRTLR